MVLQATVHEHPFLADCDPVLGGPGRGGKERKDQELPVRH